MGDANTLMTPAETRHLLKRTGFGLSKRDRRTADRNRKSRGRVVDKLLRAKAKTPRFKGDSFSSAQDAWLVHLSKTKAVLPEKLVLFWHDHFSTGIDVVERTGLMTQQNALLHTFAKGNFKEFVLAMNRNPAMMEFLDTVRNRKENPNENYPRELCELFTLGVKDLLGQPNYTQDDIVQIARAFTGWRYSAPERRNQRIYERAEAYFDEGRHDFAADFPERGPKTIFTTTGGFGAGGAAFDANGEGPDEIDTVVDILFAHRDSEGMNTIARRTAYRLLEYFAHPNPSLSVVDEVVATSNFDTTWNIQALLRAIFTHDAFFVTAAPAPFNPSTVKSVKWPIDLVIGTIRALGMKLKVDRERGLRIEGGGRSRLRSHLEEMGQELMNPPSVFGWDWEVAWLSSATLLARFVFARDVGAARGRGRNTFIPKKVLNLKLTDPDAIVDAVLAVLGLSDQLSGSERAALVDYLTDGGTLTSLDLKDEDTHDERLHGLFALALQAPAYQLH